MSKAERKLKRGKPKGHGGYSYLSTRKLPETRKYILRYLSAVRERLIEDIGGTEDNLTAAQIILIDRLVTKLGVVRCIEEYIRENSVMEGKELAPSLGTHYLAYNNSVRLDLQALGINKRVSETLSPLEVAAEIDREEEKAKELKRSKLDSKQRSKDK